MSSIIKSAHPGSRLLQDEAVNNQQFQTSTCTFKIKINDPLRKRTQHLFSYDFTHLFLLLLGCQTIHSLLARMSKRVGKAVFPWNVCPMHWGLLYFSPTPQKHDTTAHKHTSGVPRLPESICNCRKKGKPLQLQEQIDYMPQTSKHKCFPQQDFPTSKQKYKTYAFVVCSVKYIKLTNSSAQTHPVKSAELLRALLVMKNSPLAEVAFCFCWQDDQHWWILLVEHHSPHDCCTKLLCDASWGVGRVVHWHQLNGWDL